MSTAFRNIHASLTADAGQLRTQLRAAATEVDRFSARVDGAAARATRAATALKVGTVAAIVATTVALKKASTIALEFEEQMRNVNSISALSERQFQALSTEVVNLSRGLPQGASDLARGLYDIASSGFQGAEGMKVLEASAISATAGMSTTATAAKAITAVLNAYGRGAEEARSVSDVLFQTVNVGVITFDELANQLGDVVGMAAAAGVSIENVGAAVAAMTLAGLPAAEAFTSLNRVIQSVVEPSEALSTVLRAMGHENPADALNRPDGLIKTMQELQGVTGGNVQALLRLFPEIRSARGAFALMANEGQNLARTHASMADASDGAGAAQKAFNEQMKAGRREIDLLANRIRANAIQLGRHLIPPIIEAVRWFGRLGDKAGPVVGAALKAITPIARNLGDALGSLVAILGHLWDAAEPVAVVVARLAGAFVIAPLVLFARALAEIAGFLADHPRLVQVVAAIYLTRFVPALVAAAAAAGSAAWGQLATAMLALAIHGNRAATGIAATGAAMGTARAAAAGLLAVMGRLAVLAPIYAFIAGWTKAGDVAEAQAERIRVAAERAFGADDPARTARGVSEQIKEVERLIAANNEVLFTGNRAWKALRAGMEALDPRANEIEKALRGNEKLKELWDELNGRLNTIGSNTIKVARSLGLWGANQEKNVAVTRRLQELAAKLGIDLGEALHPEDVQRLADEYRKLGDEFGIAADQLANFSDEQLEALKKIDESAKKAKDSFLQFTDVIGSFDAGDPAEQAENLANAQERLADARERLADAEARVQENQRWLSRTPDRERELARARRDVAKANDEIADAQREIAKAQEEALSPQERLRKEYERTIKQAEDFLRNYARAAELGVDPQFLQRVLEAGPEKGGAILQAIVSDSSGAMARMVNESEAKLRELGERTETIGRITGEAVRRGAASIEGELMDMLRRALTADLAEVERLGLQVGQVWADSVNRGADQALDREKGKRRPQPGDPDFIGPVDPRKQPRQSSTDAWGRPRRRAIGAVDAHIAHQPTVLFGERSTGGESFIPLGRQHRARSRALWAETGRILGMAAGGIIPAAAIPVAQPAGPGGTTVVHQYHFHGSIQGLRPEDMERYAHTRRRLTALRGA